MSKDTSWCPGIEDGCREKLSPVCHVLIIEDESIIAMDLQQVLEDEGVTSFAFAVSEAEAVAAALEQRPDVITSDVKLADGTGPHAVAAIHDRLGAIPVIFITGTPQDCDRCGPPTIILGKPISARALAEAFHSLRADP